MALEQSNGGCVGLSGCGCRFAGLQYPVGLNYGRGNAPGYTHGRVAKPTFPRVPKAQFVPNETVMVAESRDMFYGLDGANWPEPMRKITTTSVRVPRPVFPKYDLGGLEEISTGFGIAMSLGALFVGVLIGSAVSDAACDAGWARHEAQVRYNKSRKR